MPMNIPRRPTTALEFWEWYCAVGAWSDCSRQTTEAEEAVQNWCKVQDALGEVFMTQYRADCIEYIKLWNKDSQLRLNDQSFLDLFMGGIYKLDKLNEDYQQSSKPSAKPRLSGVFRKGGSLVSPTVLECIDIGLIKLTVELALRNRTIFKDVPILFATYEDAPRSSPSPESSRDGRHSRGQLQINMPPPNASVVNGTELQLGGPRSDSAATWQRPADAVWRKGSNSPETHESRCAHSRRRRGSAMSCHRASSCRARRSRRRGLMPLFKAEPLLNGKCLGLYLRRGWLHVWQLRVLYESRCEMRRTPTRAISSVRCGALAARRTHASDLGRRAAAARTRSAAPRRLGARTAPAVGTSPRRAATEEAQRGSQRSRETWHMTARLARPSHQRHPRSRRVRRRQITARILPHFTPRQPGRRIAPPTLREAVCGSTQDSTMPSDGSVPNEPSSRRLELQ